MQKFMHGILAPFLVLGLVASPAEALVRKCTGNPYSSAPFVTGTVMVMIDGKMEGEMPARGSESSSMPSRYQELKSEDIFQISITCLEHDTEAGPIVTGVISVITKDGAIPFVAGYLGEMAELQAAYRRDHGRFASNLVELEFFARRTPIPLTLQTIDGGWSASVSMGDFTCRIAGNEDRTEAPRCADREGSPLAIAAD